MFDADVVDELKVELTAHQWRLLLKLGLCIGCEVALRQVIGAPVSRSASLEEEDYGRPFEEESD